MLGLPLKLKETEVFNQMEVNHERNFNEAVT